VRSGVKAAAIIGVDTGGTFTDLIACVDGEIRRHKVLSTPDNPARAVLHGLRELLPGPRPWLLTYGTTVATNALLERKGARVLLVTTAGFEDIVEIGRQNRPELYALEPRPPQPLVPRGLRVGVRERMAHTGVVLSALRPGALRRLVAEVRRRRPQAVAVCLLHAYANPRHERAIGAALAADPSLFCSLSHELIAEYREYERLSTTVINAYVGPVMQAHLRDLEHGLSGTRFRVMQSNGGAISAPLAGREAVRTVLSGPAAGVIGAWTVARSLGLRRVITFDMGGTSTDVSLIDGAVRHQSEWAIGGLPLKIPAIDIHTVGAGGGSIAQVDSGGALKVGPESAGAHPGPACYGKGRLPTVTDANVVLGRLVIDAFLDGRMSLQPERARAAVTGIGRKLHLDPDAAAEGIVRVVNAGMERAVRRISVERGYDPRAYALLAFGGAAGQHACELAAALGIRRVVLPRHPGLLSAWGAATASVHRDYVQTVNLTDPSPAQLRTLFAPLARAAHAALRVEGIPRAQRRLLKSLDMRYQGQSFDISVPFSARCGAAFHSAHRRRYGYADAQRALEVVNLRLLAVGRGPRVETMPAKMQAPSGPRTGRVRWHGRWRRTRVYARPQLAAGARITGPALVTELSATTFVPPGWQAVVHPTGHLQITDAH
jgi:N-methylhydantoinase A